MANEDNLIPMSERSESEVRELARKGGENSGITRRKRKAMREQAELLLSLPFNKEIKDGNGRALIDKFCKQANIDPDDIDNQMAMTIAMWVQALSGGKGSVSAFNSLRELVGEKETKIVIDTGDETINELNKLIEKRKGE